MLKSLEIKNYAIIEEVNLQFKDGLTVITGETGAGKSILLGALGLILGERADTSVLYNKEAKCIVEGSFEVSKYKIQDFFENHDLDYEDTCAIRREINAKGKSRAFINDTPTTLDVLKQLSKSLVDLHQQFDTRDINEESKQLDIIDSIASTTHDRKTYKEGYDEWKKMIQSRNEYEAQLTKANQENDFNQFLLNELDLIKLEPGELAELEHKTKLMEQSGEIIQSCQAIVHSISESEQSMINSLTDLIRPLSSSMENVPALSNLHDKTQQVIELLHEITDDANSLTSSIDMDPQSLKDSEERLDEINRILSKHRLSTEEELLLLHEKLSDMVADHSSLEEKITLLTSKIEKAEKNLFAQAKKISSKRKGVIRKTEKSVVDILHSMSMDNAQLKIELVQEEKFKPGGIDRIQFLFQANKGGDFKPMGKVASGGELSRLNLAIKSIMADAVTMPTLIFDEIDTGISGNVSMKMGTILKQLSKKHQTICITHSPQIASKGKHHFAIFKEDTKHKTITKVVEVDNKDIEKEIAKMLGGDPVTQEAIENARQLLNS